MELLNDTLVKQFKHNLAETFKEEINVKIKDFKKTFKENGYIILRPRNYINQALTDLKIINENNFTDDQVQLICVELAIKQFIESVNQSIKGTKKEGKHQHKYALYEMRDRENNLYVVIIDYSIAKELPSQHDLNRAISLSGRKNYEEPAQNVKINVENADEEIKNIFLGILLHTDFYIQKPAPTSGIFGNRQHKATIKTNYLSLRKLDNQTVELLDETGKTINPEHYVALDLIKICKGDVLID